MDDLLEEPWGLLVTKEGGEDERVPVLGKEFIIGRAKGNSVIFFKSSTNIVTPSQTFLFGGVATTKQKRKCGLATRDQHKRRFIKT